MTSDLTRCTQCDGDTTLGAVDGLCARCLADFAFDETPPVALPFAAGELPGGTGARGAVSVRFGDYELLEEIAHGGMGVVYRARQVSLNRIVAVKMIRSARLADERAVRRFHMEAEAAAKLSHPNIVPIYEVGCIDGQHFYSMGYVAGQSLAQRIRDHILPPRLAATYLRGIAQAIHYAHTQDVLHRDIKPGNVLLDGNDDPHVTDFGLAKFTSGDSDLTVSGTVIGSPSYMSPEQAEGHAKKITPRSDVYALGAVLYELLTGRPPFRAETPLQTMRLAVESEPVPPRVLNPRIPADLETICLKCLQKEPERRYASADELAEELRRYQENEPIHARPVGLAGRAVRWCKRSPKLAAAIGAAVFACIAGVAGIAWQWREAEQQRLLAEARLYVADMNLAMQALDNGNLARARELQAAHVQDAARFGSFEWGHIAQRSVGDRALVIRGHNQTVRQVAFTPDGAAVVSRDVNGTLKAWDASTGRVRWSASGIVSIGGFHGGRLAASFEDGAAGFVALADGQRQPLVPGAGLAIGVVEEGQTLVTTSSNHLVQFHDARTGTLRAEYQGIGGYVNLHMFQVPRVAIAHDGALVAVAHANALQPLDGNPDQLEIFERATGNVRLRQPQPSLLAMAFSPDGRQLAVGEGFGVLKLLNTGGGHEMEVLQCGEASIHAVAFSPDGRSLAAGSSDTTVYLYDLGARRLIGTPLRGHDNGVQAVAFSPDGQRLASGSRDGTVRLWDLQAGRTAFTTSKLRASNPVRIAFSPESSTIAVENIERGVNLLDRETLAVRHTITDAVHPIRFTMLSPTMLRLTMLSANEPRAIKFHNPPASPTFGEWQHPALATAQNVVALSADGSRAAIGANDGRVFLLHGDNGRELANVAPHSARVTWVEFSRNGHWLLSGAEDGTLAATALGTGRPVVHPLGSHERAITRIAISPRRPLAASCSLDGSIRLWDLRERKLKAALAGHSQAVFAVAFSPDGRLLASASADGTVKLWSVVLRQEMATLRFHDPRTRQGDAGPVMSVAFSPDGRSLAALGGAGFLRVWHGGPPERPSE